jgi:hypothetical protein
MPKTRSLAYSWSPQSIQSTVARASDAKSFSLLPVRCASRSDKGSERFYKRLVASSIAICRQTILPPSSQLLFLLGRALFALETGPADVVGHPALEAKSLARSAASAAIGTPSSLRPPAPSKGPKTLSATKVTKITKKRPKKPLFSW